MRSISRWFLAEIVVAIPLALGAIFMIQRGHCLHSSVPILGAGLAALLVIGVLAQAAKKLIGPLYYCDFVHSLRRGGICRARYVHTVLLLLLLVALCKLAFAEPSLLELCFRSRVPPPQLGDLERFVHRFFAAFLLVQLLLPLFFLPATAAGAVVELKSRGTLEVLFTTDLHSREIVLGYMISRMSSVGLRLLARWPILCLVELLGLVEPGPMLAGLAAVGSSARRGCASRTRRSSLPKRPRHNCAGFWLSCKRRQRIPPLLSRGLRRRLPR